MGDKRKNFPEIDGLKSCETLYECFIPSRLYKSNSVHMIGFEFDGTACFRKGTVKGPDAIRKDSPGIESFSPYLNADLEDYSNLYDLGNLDLGPEKDEKTRWRVGTDSFLRSTEQTDIKENEIIILTLGGEHSISYAPIASYLKAYPDLVLLHLDAHADLRDGYEGYYYSHASIIRRALDLFESGHELIQYGVRSGTRSEYEWMRENKTQCTSLDQLVERLHSLDEDRPIYLTLDLDFFDPSYFPGTGTPEPGGETFHSFVKINKILRNKRFVGCDAVELSPDLDSSGNSSVFAAKVVRELALSLNLSLDKRAQKQA